MGVEKAPWMAEIKAALAREGHQLAPDASMQVFEKPQGGRAVVVLERVKAGYTPDYCVHGYATCVRCDEPCYLGSETHKVVSSREAYALCIQCAELIIPAPESGAQLLRHNIKDHRREDGPHE